MLLRIKKTFASFSSYDNFGTTVISLKIEQHPLLFNFRTLSLQYVAKQNIFKLGNLLCVFLADIVVRSFGTLKTRHVSYCELINPNCFQPRVFATTIGLRMNSPGEYIY
jgi:hypothetical protein